MTEGAEKSGLFEATRWSRVRAAAGLDRDGSAALEELCLRYWPPLYAYLRHRGYREPDAKDMLQGFFARFLARNDFDRADPSKGRFRSYLVTALENHLKSEARAAGAQMRGGGRIHVAIDSMDAEKLCARDLPPDVSAQERCDREWVATILNCALDRLRDEQNKSGQAGIFIKLLPWLTTPPDDGVYQSIADDVGKTKPAVAMTMKRLRQRFRELVRNEVRETCQTPDDFQKEWELLISIL